jgi:anaerobic selenocysteine-containing dehydrogenase
MSQRRDRRRFVERMAESIGLIPRLSRGDEDLPSIAGAAGLASFPPESQWDEWLENAAGRWPERVRRRRMLVPTTCFNCESACGLLAYVDKDSLEVARFEGNPRHPASRGRTCAKGPATINQVKDPDRILYPLKRKGPRGSGQWERVSWADALADIGGRIRKALQEERRNEVVYHVGRPGHEGYMDRVLKAWGIDGHNSHTNVCSGAARFGYALWQKVDRPSPDYSRARFILLISAHLESGHYFNPHAQRIMEGLQSGAEMAVMDPRLSNTASLATYWLPTFPGSEAAVLLAMARILLAENLYDRAFLEHWVNWRDYMRHRQAAGSAGAASAAPPPRRDPRFEDFIALLLVDYAAYTPEFAAQEAGVDPEMIVKVARRIGAAGSRFAAHTWRAAGSGNLGGWAVARAMHFLSVLTGSVGTEGGTSPAGWNKFVPDLPHAPPAQRLWNELHFPKEWPLCHYEMSFLLPHFLREGRGRLDTYFTRVFNPVWTYPDGFAWIEMLSDEAKVGCHVALTPTWSETAFLADYVLPMGHGPERHDLNSYETHDGVWIAFRQPVLREALRRMGRPVELTWQANPGEVWEEDEFWIALSWAIDPDGALGIRRHFESTDPARAGQRLTVDEYYGHIFDRVPGLGAAAAAEGLTPLDYMKRFGAFAVKTTSLLQHAAPLPPATLDGSRTEADGRVVGRDGATLGIVVDGVPRKGFPTPTGRQELFSVTMTEWGWPEYATPTYIRSHVHPSRLDRERGEFCLLPTFRLPNLIHSRSGNSKWLTEISHRNPIWMHTSDAARLSVTTDDLLRIETEIGHFVDRVWVTEAVRPGVVCCSHHIGRWRREQDALANRWATNTVAFTKEGNRWRMRTVAGPQPGPTSDPDTLRIWWKDGGVHQNITHAVHPDPVSGMHCWHQKVRVVKAGPDDHYGDVLVDMDKSQAVYREWLSWTRPGKGPPGLRRPLWFNRPLRPADEAYRA